MASDEHVKLHIRRAFHVNGLAPFLQRLPSCSRLIFAVLIHVFDVDVLHVRAKVRKSPRNALVVPDNYVGQSGNGETHHVKARLWLCVRFDLKLRLIPDVRNVMPKVHVIREQRLASGGVRAGDDPVIRARNQSFNRATEWLTGLRFASVVCHSERSEESAVRHFYYMGSLLTSSVRTTTALWRLRLRLIHCRFRLAWRMVAPRR